MPEPLPPLLHHSCDLWGLFSVRIGSSLSTLTSFSPSWCVCPDIPRGTIQWRCFPSSVPSAHYLLDWSPFLESLLLDYFSKLAQLYLRGPYLPVKAGGETQQCKISLGYKWATTGAQLLFCSTLMDGQFANFSNSGRKALTAETAKKDHDLLHFLFYFLPVLWNTARFDHNFLVHHCDISLPPIIPYIWKWQLLRRKKRTSGQNPIRLQCSIIWEDENIGKHMI